MRSREREEEEADIEPGSRDCLEMKGGKDTTVKVPLAVALTLAREKGRSTSSCRKIFKNNYPRYLERVSLLEKFDPGNGTTAGKIQEGSR